MILITRNSTNDVILTLTEKATLPVCEWLFVFKNDIEGVSNMKTFHASDISITPGRFNEFHIIDNAVELPYSGQMDFTPSGFWSYTIYEMIPASPADLNPANAVGIAETGKALVVDSTENPTSTYMDDDNRNTSVYDA